MIESRLPSDRKRGLILTKLDPARVSAEFVPRERVIDDILNARAHFQLVTIVGAAGSGKSVLLGQLYDQISPTQPSCWISFDQDDNNVISFLTYFSAALSEIDATLGSRAFSMLTADLDSNVEAAFQTICEDISRIEDKASIFLDDFQHITVPEIIAGMNKLIVSLPKNVTVFFASRSEIHLELSKRRLDGSLKEIAQEDLNLSNYESTLLMQCMHDISLNESQAQQLTKITEGWATGIQLAGMNLKQSQQDIATFIAQFSAVDKSLHDYLIETVFDSQPEPVKLFLIKTAPLLRMNAELCEHVTGVADNNSMLDYLRSENLFLIPLDTEQKWFRYHHLFAEFLLSQLYKHDKSAFEDVSLLASDWFADNGFHTEAIKYLLSAGEYSRAAELIAFEGKKVALILGDHRTILDWMRLLPEQYHDQHPQILLNYAWSQVFTRSSNAAQKIAQDVSQGINNRRNPRWDLSEQEIVDLNYLIDAILAISYNANDEVNKAKQFSQEKLLSGSSAPVIHQATLNNSLSLACFGNLEFDEGLRISRLGRIQSQQCGAHYLTLWADWISAAISAEQGKINDADGFISRGIEDANRLGGMQSYGGALVRILNAELLYYRGELDRASAEISSCEWFASFYGPLEALLISHRLQAKILFAKALEDKAHLVLRTGQELGLISNLPRLSHLLGAERIKLYLRSGDINAAISAREEWESEFANDSSFSRNGHAYIGDIEKEIQARILIAQESYSDALVLLKRLTRSAGTGLRGRRMVELQILKAIALWKEDRAKASMRELAIATEFAAHQNFRAPFMEADPVLTAILDNMAQLRSRQDLGDLSITINFERDMRTYLGGDTNTSQDVGISENDNWCAAPLTPRELEIVKLLVLGMDNQELADTLFVTVPTVKWHIHNVFDKLGVRRRTAAVAKAQKLKLVN